MKTPDPVTLDPTLTDIVIPSAAILISAAIAIAVIRIQLAAARRDRRSDAIGKVAAAISHIIAEASRKRAGEAIDLEPAFSAFDAAVIQLVLAVPRRDRVTVGVLRDHLFVTYLNEPENVEADAWTVRTELEQWAVGNIPNREFKRLAAWGGHSEIRQRTPAGSWAAFVRLTAMDPGITSVEIAELTRLRDRDPYRWLDGVRERMFTWWYRR